jgi:hypothetical protein
MEDLLSGFAEQCLLCRVGAGEYRLARLPQTAHDTAQKIVPAGAELALLNRVRAFRKTTILGRLLSHPQA